MPAAAKCYSSPLFITQTCYFHSLMASVGLCPDISLFPGLRMQKLSLYFKLILFKAALSIYQSIRMSILSRWVLIHPKVVFFYNDRRMRDPNKARGMTGHDEVKGVRSHGGIERQRWSPRLGNSS